MLNLSELSSLQKVVLKVTSSVILGYILWAVYGRALDSPFIFDDFLSVKTNSSIVRLWPLYGDANLCGPLNPAKDLPTSGRPLVNLTLALNYYFGGIKPVGYHSFNLVLHLLSALLLALIVKHILRLEYFGKCIANVSAFLAFLTALLWAVHPLNTETVIYITQRTELMVGFFYLATLYCSLQYWSAVTKNKRTLWLILATFNCMAGMACKEVMVTAPLLILLFERTFIAGSFRQAWRKSRGLYICLAFTWFLLLALNYDQPRAASAGFNLDVSPISWWCTQSKVLWLYLKLVVWPWPLAIHYEERYLTFSTAWLWILATMLLTSASLILLWRKRALGYVAVWTLLILLPTFTVPIITEVMTERRMYLPLAALMTLVVAGFYWLIERISQKIALTIDKAKTRSRLLTISVVVAASLAICWSLLDVHRLAAYHDDITLWQNTIETQPNDAVAHNNLGHALSNAGKTEEALDQFQLALKLDSKDAAAHGNLGIMLLHTGHLQQAIEELKTALELAPDYCDAESNLGVAFMRLGRPTEAIAQFHKTIQRNPNCAGAHVNLGIVLGNLGQTEDALKEFQTALQLNPSDGNIYYYLMLANTQLNHHTEALTAARQALELAEQQGQTELAKDIEEWLHDHNDDSTNSTTGH